MFEHLVDEEITLKLKDYQDSEAVFQLIDQSREHLKQWMPSVEDIHSVEDVNKRMRKHLKELTEQEGIHFLIYYKNDLAGSISIKEIDWQVRSAELGYWLGSGFTGRGIINRTSTALLEYVFEEMDLHKVEIWVAEKNAKSRRIPEHLGFIKEGMRRDNELIDGTYYNMVIYGLLKEEWRQQRLR